MLVILDFSYLLSFAPVELGGELITPMLKGLRAAPQKKFFLECLEARTGDLGFKNRGGGASTLQEAAL